jgi:TRAP-type C4-dicarboxylate transport system substrate-binding protein
MIPPRNGRRVIALALVASVVLSACADPADAGGRSGGGEGVEFGATKEEYAKALADIDPVVIHAQSPSPKGALTGRKFEDYMKAVEEWSDGKITFDIAYSNAVAQPTEIDDALADGRLDLGSVLPAYEPQEYPAGAALSAATFAGDQGAYLGLMESNTWWLDVGYHTPQMFDELADAGVTLLFPAFNSGLITMMCSEPRRSVADFKGQQVIVGTEAQSTAVKNLGASPVSLPYPEIFESLQRGVADCTMNSLLVAELGGFLDLVPNVVVDSGAGFGSGAGAWAFSTEAWESYPLVVRQLLFDRLDAFMVANYESVWETISSAVGKIKSAGGEITEYADDARANIAATNSSMLDELRGNAAVGDGDAWVDYLEKSIDKWHQEIPELGFGKEVSYEDFPDFYQPSKVDLKPLVDAVFKDVLLEHRPA